MHQRVVARLDAASAGNFVKIIFSICSKCLIFKLSVAWSTRGLKTKLMRMTWELLTHVIDIVIWSPTLGCKVCILKTVANPFNDTWSRLQKVQDWEAFIFSRSRFTYFLDLYNEICSSMYYVFNKKKSYLKKSLFILCKIYHNCSSNYGKKILVVRRIIKIKPIPLTHPKKKLMLFSCKSSKFISNALNKSTGQKYL